MLLRSSAAVVFVFPSLVAGAQALPAASREPIDVGAAFAFGSPGYQDTPTYVEGVSLFATAGLRGRLAAQLDVHLNSLITPVDVGENSYLLGPRISLLHEDRINMYVKAQGGFGQFSYQTGSYADPRSFTYGIFAGGGGIEYRLSQHITVRAIELEFQDWPGFPGGALHPVVASIGAAWRL